MPLETLAPQRLGRGGGHDGNMGEEQTRRLREDAFNCCAELELMVENTDEGSTQTQSAL